MNLVKRLLNNSVGFDYLTMPEEKQEIKFVGQLQYIKLKYSGKQYFSEKLFIRLWTVVNDFHDELGRSRQGGTFSLEGLKELGVI